MSIVVFLKNILRALHDSRVPYMLTGSLASTFYFEPRATQDIDIVVELNPENLDLLVNRLLLDDLYISRDAAREAFAIRSQFNAIDPETGWKVDLIVRKDRRFSEEEFNRRQRVSLFGMDVMLASREDLILAKLEWARMGDSAHQRTDAARLISSAGESLDRGHIEKWLDPLGIRGEWEAVIAGTP